MKVSVLRIFVRRRTGSAFLLALLMIASSVFLYAPHVGASSLVQHGPIHISGNAGFSAANGVVSGNGTTSNPYIISGWSISSTVPACVDIESTTAYFIIENLQVNCGSYTTVSIALTLNNVSNGEVLSSSLFPAASILSSKNDVISGNTLQGGGCGAQACLQTGQVLYITHSSSITVSNNQISLGQFNSCVVGADLSSNLQLVNNTIQGGDVPCGLGLYATNNSVISQNRITHPSYGTYLFANTGLSIYKSLNDQVFANNITREQNGITIVSTNNTSIYHNNLINNNVQASENDSISNQWDNGYPSGGNHWSDYKGVDRCGAAQKNTCPFPDGIGDTPYAFNSNLDRYPLMAPFVPAANVETGHASISIVGNNGFTAANGVRQGSGTDTDPYVISDWNINTDSDWIKATNTTAFFVVQNTYLCCGFGGIVFTNVTNGRAEYSQSYQYGTTGITIQNSRNVVVAFDTATDGSGSPHETGGNGLAVLSSTNVVLSGNSLTGNQGDNLYIANSNNVSITGNSIGGAAFYGMDIQGSSGVTISGNSFSHSGLRIGLGSGPDPYNFTNDNLVNGKPLYYYDGCGSGLTLDGVPVGQLIIANCSNVHLDNLQIHSTEVGVTLFNVQHALVENTNATLNHYQGMDVYASSNVIVENSDFSMVPPNYFDYDSQYGMMISGSNNIVVEGSRFSSEHNSMVVASSVNVTISGTTFEPYVGALLWLEGNTNAGVHVFHNNFYFPSTTNSFYDTQTGDSWDNGYPSGGNYYSNYGGVDNCSGPMQNICSSPDGIGDTSFAIPGGVYADHYPLMKPFVASPPLVSVVLGMDGILSWSFFTSGSWSQWHSLGMASASSPAVCASGGGRLDAVIRGTNDGIYHTSFSNGNWSGIWDSPSGGTDDQPACASQGGLLNVVLRGMHNEIWYNYRNDTSGIWGTWQNLGGIAYGPPILIASPSGARLDLIVQGANYSLWHKSFVNGQWSSSWDSLSGGTPSPPTAVSDGGMLHIVVRGTHNEIWYNTLNFATSLWSGWTMLDGATQQTPSLAIDASGGLHLFVIGMDNGIYCKSRPYGGTWSSGWDSPGGATIYPVAVVAQGLDVHILVIGMDNSIDSNTLAGTYWLGWTRLGGETLSIPSLTTL